MKSILFLFLNSVFFFSNILNAQNIVPDPGFEMVQIMPGKESNYIYCTKNWVPPNLTNSDYYHTGAIGKHGGAPKNTFGNQEPHSGNAYAGICIQANYIEYLETKLTSTLIKDQEYLIEFYISRAEKSITSVNEFGVLFTDKVRHGFDVKGIPHQPNIDFTNPDGYKNKNEWIKLSAIYKAEGYENALIIGYFNYDQPKGYKGFAHYYIDDVTVTLIQKKNNTEKNVKKPESISQSLLPKPGETIILKNIFFEINKSELLPQSYSEMDKLVHYLDTANNTSIKISGHTDNTGKQDQNIRLSEARAKAVADYLILKGIDKTRINFIGYGGSQPIMSNDTEDGKQQNRRVEFIILKK